MYILRDHPFHHPIDTPQFNPDMPYEFPLQWLHPDAPFHLFHDGPVPHQHPDQPADQADPEPEPMEEHFPEPVPEEDIPVEQISVSSSEPSSEEPLTASISGPRVLHPNQPADQADPEPEPMEEHFPEPVPEEDIPVEQISVSSSEPSSEEPLTASISGLCSCGGRGAGRWCGSVTRSSEDWRSVAQGQKVPTEKECHCNFFAWFDMVFDINHKNAIMDDVADADQLDDVVVGFQEKLMEL
nr:uncharacterized protein LOC112785875 [Arachis hypogaea]